MPFTATTIGTGIAIGKAAAPIIAGALAPAAAAPATFLGLTAGGWATAGIIGAGVAGTGLTAYGQYQAGKSAEEANEYNAAVQRNQAIREEQVAKYKAGLQQEKGRRLLASQRVGYAASGVTGAGTPLLVFQQTARDISQDIAVTQWSGAQGASHYRSQAGLSLMYGKSARRAGVIGAGTSLLTGASNALYNYKRFG